MKHYSASQLGIRLVRELITNALVIWSSVNMKCGIWRLGNTLSIVMWDNKNSNTIFNEHQVSKLTDALITLLWRFVILNLNQLTFFKNYFWPLWAVCRTSHGLLHWKYRVCLLTTDYNRVSEEELYWYYIKKIKKKFSALSILFFKSENTGQFVSEVALVWLYSIWSSPFFYPTGHHCLTLSQEILSF